jgi:hypothetical protein
MKDADTITRDELAQYFERRGNGLAWSASQAQRVFSDVKEHREPEYADGGIYADAYGEVWRFHAPDPDGGWTEPVWNAPGDANTYAFDTPRRPLVRLIPESAMWDEYLTPVTPNV